MKENFKKIFLDTTPIIYLLDNDKNFKTMDSLQLAVAVLHGCDSFLTNDKQLKQFQEMNCVTVEEWIF